VSVFYVCPFFSLSLSRMIVPLILPPLNAKASIIVVDRSRARYTPPSRVSLAQIGPCKSRAGPLFNSTTRRLSPSSTRVLDILKLFWNYVLRNSFIISLELCAKLFILSVLLYYSKSLRSSPSKFKKPCTTLRQSRTITHRSLSSRNSRHVSARTFLSGS